MIDQAVCLASRFWEHLELSGSFFKVSAITVCKTPRVPRKTEPSSAMMPELRHLGIRVKGLFVIVDLYFLTLPMTPLWFIMGCGLS